MLHFSEKNRVAFTKKLSAPRLRNEVDAFGRPPRENDLVCAGRTKIAGGALPRSFIRFGRARAQKVETPMHIGVLVFVIISQCIEHTSRFLRRRGAVEINQGMAVHLLAKNREIFANGFPIYSAGDFSVHNYNVLSVPAIVDSVLNRRLSILRLQRGRSRSPSGRFAGARASQRRTQ